jgi:hypothetical protein
MMQDQDPHHFQPDPTYFYVFIVLAPLLVMAIIYFGMKIVNRMETRKNDDGGNAESPQKH